MAWNVVTWVSIHAVSWPRSAAIISATRRACARKGVRIPTDTKELTAEEREAVEKLQEKLEEDDDVVNVYTTMAEADEE